MNKEDNYQSLRVNAASNDDDSTYTELKKTSDVEDNYQSLTWTMNFFMSSVQSYKY